MRGLPVVVDENLIADAASFSDAGVYRLREDLLILQSVDFFPPPVDDPFVYGQIAAANSMSDIYAMGGNPTTALNIAAFPDDELDLDILTQILAGGAERLQTAGAVLLGGHTVRDSEIKYGLSVMGVVEPRSLLTNQHALPGDLLVLTKPLGTGFVTTAFKAGRCPQATIETAIDSMIQLNEGASHQAVAAGAHAATDITGFGLAGHACEIAQASNVSIILELNQLPLLPGATHLATKENYTRASTTNRAFADPLSRIEGTPDPTLLEFAFDAQTSGGLLVSVAAERAQQLVEQARDHGALAACLIGSVIDREKSDLILRA